MSMEVSFTAKPISYSQAKHLKKQIIGAKNLDIICHNNSDEDAVACAKAIQWFRRLFNKESRIILNNAEETYKPPKSITKTDKADTVLCVDFSSSNRIMPEVLEYIKSAKRILCIDHHAQGDILGKIPKDIYVDTSAKSCSGVIMRLFDRLKIKPPKNILKQIFCGMTDDLRKNNYLKYDESLIPIKTKHLQNDKNSQELYERLEKELSTKDQNEIISHLNIMSRLTPAEKSFKDSLSSRVKFSPNGKFGYIVIPPDDKEWKTLGGDNKITSTIMANFRAQAIENKNDPLDIIAIFYPTKEFYQVSMHSKNNNVVNLINKLKETDPNLSAGGHTNRGGGRIYSLDPIECAAWVDNFTKIAAEF